MCYFVVMKDTMETPEQLTIDANFLQELKKLSANGLAEWAAWQKQNWMHIIRASERARHEGVLLSTDDGAQPWDFASNGGTYGLSIWLWLNFPQYIEQREAEGETPNYGEHMLAGGDSDSMYP